jgi:hypothetical protein
MGRWDNKPSLAEMKKDFMSHLTEEGQAYFNEVIDKDGTTRIDDLTAWITDLDDSRLRQVCPECAKKPENKGRNVMFMHDIKKLHEEHPNIESFDPNSVLNRGWPRLWDD